MNAKEELLNLVDAVGSPVYCARIRYENWDDNDREILLKPGFSDRDLEQLNFEYDNGYGCQFLTGAIWFTDGTWAERSEYDGSEWWSHRSRPEIPEALRTIDIHANP